jgi:hypothetical protein
MAAAVVIQLAEVMAVVVVIAVVKEVKQLTIGWIKLANATF